MRPPFKSMRKQKVLLEDSRRPVVLAATAMVAVVALALALRGTVGDQSGGADAGSGHDVALLVDRAGAALQAGDPRGALRTLDSVAPGAAGGPVLWHRALALRDLGLSLAAAEMFDRVAALREPGLGEAAPAQAAELRRGTLARREGWREAERQGLEMERGGPPIAPELARRHPGTARLHLESALSPSLPTARFEALLPLAESVDATMPAAGLAALSRRLANADGDRPREALLVARQQEPWFRHARVADDAARAAAAGRIDEAERELGAALDSCHAAGIELRCAVLEDALAQLQLRKGRKAEALRIAAAAWDHARAAGEWALETRLLRVVAAAEPAPLAGSLAAGYAAELRLREAN